MKAVKLDALKQFSLSLIRYSSNLELAETSRFASLFPRLLVVMTTDDWVSGSEQLAADCVDLADYTKSARLVILKQFSSMLICIGVNRGYCQNLALSVILF